ncbi:hypothetical protein K437DRAFT_256416 [Tilletiaria anomala UBC 951]|uniref:Uncharacterized protein n=1 Tax=Tilletiaria anomala (strain ATCC 24038 / CBS 436.72 / UBC 951) TaxID=1037660 RepID=A0A066W048_TILAU|nr:uncharacterized protein K437DRAFT_256416 [Tilletiaria anomala UBC 951]KDN45893.1 hypothetical protein K437DRAFT_256416 [Tilletiaria anomala UBC 951]
MRRPKTSHHTGSQSSPVAQQQNKATFWYRSLAPPSSGLLSRITPAVTVHHITVTASQDLPAACCNSTIITVTAQSSHPSQDTSACSYTVSTDLIGSLPSSSYIYSQIIVDHHCCRVSTKPLGSKNEAFP